MWSELAFSVSVSEVPVDMCMIDGVYSKPHVSCGDDRAVRGEDAEIASGGVSARNDYVIARNSTRVMHVVLEGMLVEDRHGGKGRHLQPSHVERLVGKIVSPGEGSGGRTELRATYAHMITPHLITRWARRSRSPTSGFNNAPTMRRGTTRDSL